MNSNSTQNPSGAGAPAPPVSTPPTAQRRMSGSSVLSGNTASSQRRREKREKSIRTLQEEIRRQLEEEEAAGVAAGQSSDDDDGRIVTPTRTRSLLSSQRIQIQAEAMVNAAIRAEEEARRNPPPAMTASQIAAYSERRAREIVSEKGTSANSTSSMDMEARINIQSQALEHAITQSQINAGIFLGGEVETPRRSPALFPDPSSLPRAPPLFGGENDTQLAGDPLLLSPISNHTTESTPLLTNRKLDYSATGKSNGDKGGPIASDKRRTGGCPSMTRMMIFVAILASVVVMTWTATNQGRSNDTESSRPRGKWFFLRGGRPNRLTEDATTNEGNNDDDVVSRDNSFYTQAPTSQHGDLNSNHQNEQTKNNLQGNTDAEGARTHTPEFPKDDRDAIDVENAVPKTDSILSPVDESGKDAVAIQEGTGFPSLSPSKQPSVNEEKTPVVRSSENEAKTKDSNFESSEASEGILSRHGTSPPTLSPSLEPKDQSPREPDINIRGISPRGEEGIVDSRVTAPPSSLKDSQSPFPLTDGDSSKNAAYLTIEPSAADAEKSEDNDRTEVPDSIADNAARDEGTLSPPQNEFPSSLSGSPSTVPVSRASMHDSATPSMFPAKSEIAAAPEHTVLPTVTPSYAPTRFPTMYPTTMAPSLSPTQPPTFSPTVPPTTLAPTPSPTNEPSSSPTLTPTRATVAPTLPPTLPAVVTGPLLPPEADWYFASLLLDVKGFYFPSEIDLDIPPGFVMDASNGKDVNVKSKILSRGAARKLSSSFRPVKFFYHFMQRSKAPNVDIDWTLDWKKHMGQAEAIGEYYLNKGLDLVDSLSGETSHTKQKSAVHKKKSVGTSNWAFDWERDPERALELGKTYSTIGEAIEDHYREAFGKRHGSSRVLKKKEKQFETPTGKTAEDLALNWQRDWERGLQLSSLFDDLSSIIQDHYFDLMFGHLEKSAIQSDPEELMAGLYSMQGSHIVEYYRQKSRDISNFYFGSKGKDWMHLDSDTVSTGKAIEKYYRETYRTKLK